MFIKKSFSFIYFLISILLLFSLENCNQPAQPESRLDLQHQSYNSPNSHQAVNANELNRHPHNLHYSKHARCRMNCRHINETEIIEILERGEINYHKSELTGEPCRRKFAVEGMSKEGQKLRIIFAPCGNEMTVVTCIDLGVEWACDCK